MNNKNFNHNDNESFMEGIYGCMERIETGIIELQKAKTSDVNPTVSHHRCLSFSFHWLPILVVYSLEANIDTRQRQ